MVVDDGVSEPAPVLGSSTDPLGVTLEPSEVAEGASPDEPTLVVGGEVGTELELVVVALGVGLTLLGVLLALVMDDAEVLGAVPSSPLRALTLPQLVGPQMSTAATHPSFKVR